MYDNLMVLHSDCHSKVHKNKITKQILINNIIKFINNFRMSKEKLNRVRWGHRRFPLGNATDLDNQEK